MAYDINCPHCGYGYTPKELLQADQLNKAGTFKANCKTLCKKDFVIEVVPSFNYFENKIEEVHHVCKNCNKEQSKEGSLCNTCEQHIKDVSEALFEELHNGLD